MLRILLISLAFPFIFQSAYAQSKHTQSAQSAKPESCHYKPYCSKDGHSQLETSHVSYFVEDELIKESPKWACPSSVQIGGVEYEVNSFWVNDGPPESRGGNLVPEPRKHIFYRFSFTSDMRDIYLVCGYKGLETELIIHAKGATFCGKGGTPPVYFSASALMDMLRQRSDDGQHRLLRKTAPAALLTYC